MSCTSSQQCSANSNTVTLDPIYIGDDLVININVKDDEGDVVDLTGSSMTLTIKKKKSDELPVFQETQPSNAMLDPLSGKVIFIVDSAITSTFENRNYVYDILWTTNAGTTATIFIGNFQVKQPVHQTP